MQRRNTKQRQIILDAVRSRFDHPNAEQIFRQISEVDPRISRGTVYRNLQILAEQGDILAIRLPDADRFDLNTRNHNHFVCVRCGKLSDITVEYDSKLDNSVTGDGYIILNHQTVFRGYCPECGIMSEN